MCFILVLWMREGKEVKRSEKEEEKKSAKRKKSFPNKYCAPHSKISFKKNIKNKEIQLFP